MLRLQKEAVIEVRNAKIKAVCANSIWSCCANAQSEPVSHYRLFFSPDSFQLQVLAIY